MPGACRQWAGLGTNHLGFGECALHGGHLPAQELAAQKALDAHRAKAAAVTFGLPRDIDPAVALLEEVCRSAGIVDWLAGRIALLDAEELTWGKTEESVSTQGGEGQKASIKRKATTHVLVKMYQEERKHLASVSATALSAGVAERLVRLAEAEGALLVKVIRGMIGDPELGLNEEQKTTAERVASRHLGMVA